MILHGFIFYNYFLSASVAVSFDSSFVASASSFLSSSVAFTSFSSVLATVSFVSSFGAATVSFVSSFGAATVSFVSSFGAATSSFFSWTGATVSVLGASTFVSAGFYLLYNLQIIKMLLLMIIILFSF